MYTHSRLGGGESQAENRLCQPTLIHGCWGQLHVVRIASPCQPGALSGTDLPLPGGPLVSLGPVLGEDRDRLGEPKAGAGQGRGLDSKLLREG